MSDHLISVKSKRSHFFLDAAFGNLSDLDKIEQIAKENSRRRVKGLLRISPSHGNMAYRLYLGKVKREWSSLSRPVRDELIRIGYDYTHGGKRTTDARNAKFEALNAGTEDYIRNHNTPPTVTNPNSHGIGKYRHIEPGSADAELSKSHFLFRTGYRGNKYGWTSDANAAQLSILGIEKLERKISPKSAKGNGYLFVQPSIKVMQLCLQDRVQSLLGSCTLAKVGTTAFKAGVILLDHLQTIGHEFALDGSKSEQEIDLAIEWNQVRVEWLSGNGEGHEWYPAVLSSTDRPHHKVSVHGFTINLPVYQLV